MFGLQYKGRNEGLNYFMVAVVCYFVQKEREKILLAANREKRNKTDLPSINEITLRSELIVVKMVYS